MSLCFVLHDDSVIDRLRANLVRILHPLSFEIIAFDLMIGLILAFPQLDVSDGICWK